MKPRTPIIKMARLAYKLIRPLAPTLRRYYSAYQNHKIAGIYHAGAVTIKDFCFVEKELKINPIISIVVPVYNPELVHFMEMVYSVVNQHYDNWELVLVNASTDEKLRKATEDSASIDSRIKIVGLTENKGISANTNAGIKASIGEYVALFDHDDLLHPCALHSIVEAMMGNSKADLLYTDEDKISGSGDRFFLPHYKPDWSPDLLRNVNYITHLSVIKKSLLDRLGGLRSICDGAQDYDLMLRIADENPAVKHVPKILYHWRASDQSTASDINTKQYIFKAGVRALTDHLKRNGINAKAVSIAGKPGYYEIVYPPTNYSIVISPVSPSKYAACSQWLKNLSLTFSDDVNVELIIGDWYKDFLRESHLGPIRVKFVPPSKSYWRKAADMVSKDVVVCLKIAALPISNLAIGKLASVAAAHNDTAFSPVIINSGGTIFDSGLVEAGGVDVRLFEGYSLGRNTFFGDTDWVRNVKDLSTRIVAMNSNLFKRLIRDSKEGYGRVGTISSLGGELPKKLNYVVWAHSVFNYLGPLKFTLNNQYHRVQQFRFAPSSIIYIDNWGEKYERDES